jgi:hypothetical protein
MEFSATVEAEEVIGGSSYMRRLLMQPPIAGNLFSKGRCQGRAKRAAQRFHP